MPPKVYRLSGRREMQMAVVPQEIQLLTDEIQYERVGIGQESRYPAKNP